MTMSDTMRIQFDIPHEQAKRLDAIMEATDIATKKELFNAALTFFIWAVTEKQAGKMVASIDPEGRTARVEVMMPQLETAAQKARDQRQREYAQQQAVGRPAPAFGGR
jgi:hypothetical protein